MIELHIFSIDFIIGDNIVHTWVIEATDEEIDEVMEVVEDQKLFDNYLCRKLEDADKELLTHRIDDSGQIWCKTGLPKVGVSF